MRFIRVMLSCGCRVTASYPGRVKWPELSKEERATILARAASSHICKPKAKAAPPMSPEPQKP
jgi:hypothetical protein